MHGQAWSLPAIEGHSRPAIGTAMAGHGRLKALGGLWGRQTKQAAQRQAGPAPPTTQAPSGHRTDVEMRYGFSPTDFAFKSL